MANIADILAALKQAPEVEPTPEPEPEPVVPELSDEDKTALVSKVLEYHANGALNDGLLDALLIQFSADPQTAAEVREMVASLGEAPSVNPPAAEHEDAGHLQFQALVDACMSVIESGQQVTGALFDTLVDGKDLTSEQKDQVLLAVADLCDEMGLDAGPLFAEPPADDATSADKFCDVWMRHDSPDIDLSLEPYRTWLKESLDMERFSRKAAVAMLNECVVQGIFIERDGIYMAAEKDYDDLEDTFDDECLVDQPPPEPEPEPQFEAATEEELVEAEEADATEAIYWERRFDNAAQDRLLLVGATMEGCPSFDTWLASTPVMGVYAQLVEKDKDLHAVPALSNFGAGTKAIGRILDGLLRDNTIALPYTVSIGARDPLASVVEAVFREHGALVIRGC